MSDGLIAGWAGLKEQTKRGFESYYQNLKAWCEGAKGILRSSDLRQQTEGLLGGIVHFVYDVQCND